MARLPGSTTLAAVILEAVRARSVETHTALPGIIESFNEETQTAKVRIPLKRDLRDSDGNESVGSWPILPGVPVWMPHAGGFHITLPVAKGDECLLIILERDISKWYDEGLEESPETRRMHDISDAVALVGLNRNENRLTPYNESDLVISNDAGDQSVILKAGGDIELKAGNVKVIGNLEVTGGTELGSVVNSNGTDIGEGHSHDGSATAPDGPVSPTGTPV